MRIPKDQLVLAVHVHPRPAHRRGRTLRVVTTVPDSPVGHAVAPARVAGFLQLEERTLLEPGASRFSPLVSWLVATARPQLVVELGPGDEGSIRSTVDAALQSREGATCAAVLLRSDADTGTEVLQSLMSELSERFGPALVGYETEQAGLTALRAGTAGLLHLSLFDSDEISLPDLHAWHELLAPGAVLVVTTTASDVSSNFAKAKQHVMDSYPAVSISLGLTTEAIVAQRPAEDATPIVDMLRKAPFAVGAFLALLGEQVELHELLSVEPDPAQTVQALIGRVIDQQHAERVAFLSALRVYRDETARLSDELVAARVDLTQLMEAARLQREQLVTEFLDRVDELSAKVSTTASRYSAELAEKDALLQAEGRKVEAYAGQAAIAQSVLDDIRHSTSWRMTAPVRLLSRMLARRADPPTQPEN